MNRKEKDKPVEIKLSNIFLDDKKLLKKIFSNDCDKYSQPKKKNGR